MPNRTIYLPQDLDEVSRRIGLNLSRLAQQAIRDVVEARPEALVEARLEAVCERAAALAVDWPERCLEDQRAEAQER